MPSTRGREIQCERATSAHPPFHLLTLNGFKQGLEVAFPEALVALALDNFEEDRTDDRLGEDLQQQSPARLRRAVDQDTILPESFYILAVTGRRSSMAS